MAANRLRLNMDKTELIWTGTKHNFLSKIPGCDRALTLAQSDDARWASRVKTPSALQFFSRPRYRRGLGHTKIIITNNNNNNTN